MKHQRAVLFDLDGTLLDTLADIGNAMNAALGHFGFPTHSLDEYRTFIGRGMEQLVSHALPDEARSQTPKVVSHFRAVYREALAVETKPYPGILEVLTALQNAQVPMAILSNKPDVPTQMLVQHFFSQWKFIDVRGERTGIPRKPSPEAALDMALQHDIVPARWIFVGDSAIDIQTARAAGMLSVGVLWGFRGKDELQEAGAEHLINSPGDLLRLV